MLRKISFGKRGQRFACHLASQWEAKVTANIEETTVGTNLPVDRSSRCIIPQHMLREITERGSEMQRERAWRALAMSEQIRGQRQVLTVAASPGVTSVGQKRRVLSELRAHSSIRTT